MHICKSNINKTGNISVLYIYHGVVYFIYLSVLSGGSRGLMDRESDL